MEQSTDESSRKEEQEHAGSSEENQVSFSSYTIW